MLRQISGQRACTVRAYLKEGPGEKFSPTLRQEEKIVTLAWRFLLLCQKKRRFELPGEFVERSPLSKIQFCEVSPTLRQIRRMS